MPAFTLTVDQGIGILTFDVPGAKVNTLSTPNFIELNALLGDLEKRTDLKGLILCSGKPGQFIAGADLHELGALAYVTKDQAMVGLKGGHDTFNRLAALPYPTVALVDGPSMGGGTELAISLDYRVISTNPKASMGLPETKLGLIPGWGGTQRMPRIVGIHHAIEMITGGEPFRPAKCVATGLCFDAVPSEKLLEVGKALVERSQASGEWKELRARKNQPLGLTETELFFAMGVAEGLVREKTKGHYPAPLIALAAIKEGVNLPLADGLEVEKRLATQVMGSPISANLIAIFFMTNKLERDSGVDNKEVKPREVKKVGVLGAGLMGAGIATAAARSGFPTAMVDVEDKFVAAGMKRAQDVVGGRIKIGRAKPEDMVALLSLLHGSTDRKNFAQCDVVVEAITENEELKVSAYKELASLMKADAIMASNTSTISITRLAQHWPSPERFVGMHFFNPVDRMQLVEVIRGAKTSDETVATVVALAKRFKKTPIVVRDCAGFLVNRILFPYMVEAIVLLQEGASMDEVDKAATRFGMPMGPILLQDVVGLDTSYYAGMVVAKAYADRVAETPLLGDLVKAGRMGQKSGAGFRKHEGRKSLADPAFEPFLAKHRTGSKTFTPEELTDRLFLPMLFEAVRTLEDGIARDPADLDMGLILGLGFPPFRGGILRWCDSEGAAAICSRAEKYAALGKRFHPPEMLKKLASSGGRFFPVPKDAPKWGG
ncbi:MAG TPA: 3-hydroxyacyl-CoA dehydrogenase NAD-binding domain-containing protein [Gemmatales bacterium]|nr:3-hydroxyacyl-CoA dehydrogenase NAD-binding domain-containing protein [Gemmatales bacterium]HMP58948.1 3-hydroxyacyl-CoA dehydrogenase NAD-binding domain-containing protein [Gemmatales bacterium]